MYVCLFTFDFIISYPTSIYKKSSKEQQRIYYLKNSLPFISVRKFRFLERSFIVRFSFKFEEYHLSPSLSAERRKKIDRSSTCNSGSPGL